MRDSSRAIRARVGALIAARPGLAARLRLAGLLLLLVPLFIGLQYVVREGVPRVEIRFVSEDVPVLVPVERIIERVVERIVYVPVPFGGGSPGGWPDTGLPSPSPTSPPITGTPEPAGANPSRVDGL